MGRGRTQRAVLPVRRPGALAGQIQAMLEAGRRAVLVRFGRVAILDAHVELYGRLLAERGCA